MYVDCVRDGVVGNGATRSGNRRWLLLTEQRARTAKSVFWLDVQGSVAKSTHSGLPWLLAIRRWEGVYFWPFDGWTVQEGVSVLAEVYPSLWKRSFPHDGRTADQHDAYSVAAWMRNPDREGRLNECFHPNLNTEEQVQAQIEGWILGIS